MLYPYSQGFAAPPLCLALISPVPVHDLVEGCRSIRVDLDQVFCGVNEARFLKPKSERVNTGWVLCRPIRGTQLQGGGVANKSAAMLRYKPA